MRNVSAFLYKIGRYNFIHRTGILRIMVQFKQRMEGEINECHTTKRG